MIEIAKRLLEEIRAHGRGDLSGGVLRRAARPRRANRPACSSSKGWRTSAPRSARGATRSRRRTTSGSKRSPSEKSLALLGFYHSHPDHPAAPSAYDREHAFPFFHYLVCAVAGGRAGEVTAWTLSEETRRVRAGTDRRGRDVDSRHGDASSCPRRLRPYADGAASVDVAGATVADALAELVVAPPAAPQAPLRRRREGALLRQRLQERRGRPLPREGGNAALRGRLALDRPVDRGGALADPRGRCSRTRRSAATRGT